MTNTQETYEISDLAQGILDGYFILCSPAEAIGVAIGDFLSRPDEFTFNDDLVTANEMLEAVAELIARFEENNEWRMHDWNDDAIKMSYAREIIGRLRNTLPIRKAK